MLYEVYRGLTKRVKVHTSVLPSLTFCGNIATAQYYAHNPNNQTLDGHRVGRQPTVWRAQVEINNPIIIREDYSGMCLNDLSRAFSKKEMADLLVQFQDHFRECDDWYYYQAGGKVSQNYMMEIIRRNPCLFDLHIPAYVFLDDPNIVSRLKITGFDGSINRGTAVSSQDIEYRVFSSLQIKGAVITEGGS